MSINNFLAEVKRSGFAKQSRYMVLIDLPRGPSANSNGIANPFSQDFFRVAQRNEGASYSPTGAYLASLYCEAVSLPSLNIDTKMHKVYGPGREMPYGRSYSPVNLTFYIDKDFIIKKFFDTWMASIFNKDTGHMNYYNEYTSQVHILALDTTSGDSPRARYQCTLVEAYPKTMAEVSFSAGTGDVARLQISMQYRHWVESTNASSPQSVQQGIGAMAGLSGIPSITGALGDIGGRLGQLGASVGNLQGRFDNLAGQASGVFQQAAGNLQNQLGGLRGGLGGMSDGFSRIEDVLNNPSGYIPRDQINQAIAQGRTQLGNLQSQLGSLV